MPSRANRLVLLLVVVVAASGCRREDVVRVAAASDLSLAFEELTPALERAAGRRMVVNYGSTGQLAKQIHEGAPFDLFAAASVSAVDELISSGDCDPATRSIYARGRLVLLTRDGVAPPGSVEALAEPRFTRIALANPDHAPYGRAAREALTHAGVLATLQPRLVLADNVRQALQFVRSGNADVAFVARSLVVQEKNALLVDEAGHAPLEQALVVCRHGTSEAPARALAGFLSSAEARTVLERHGLGRAP